MSLPRLVMVTRRFWPLVGGAELVTARLADGFQARGLKTTILTAQWQPEWPLHFEHHSVRVERLPQPRRRWWGTLAYMAALSKWLRARRNEFDLVYVSMLKHDAYAAIGAGQRAGFPVVLRAEGGGLTGDCHWQLNARFGFQIKRRCEKADAFIAPSPLIEREMIASGFARNRIHYIPNGVPVSKPVNSEARRAARQALGDVHPALKLSLDAPLVVYTGRLHSRKGLDVLLDAWTQLAAEGTPPYLWLVGDGESDYRRALFDEIQSRRLAPWVVLAGAFDDVDDILQAADLFVLPSFEEGMSLSLLEAMGAGLPVIATDIAANRVLVDDGEHGLLAPVGDGGAIVGAVRRLLSAPEERERLGAAARARVVEHYSLERMLDSHVALFDQVLSRTSN